LFDGILKHLKIQSLFRSDEIPIRVPKAILVAATTSVKKCAVATILEVATKIIQPHPTRLKVMYLAFSCSLSNKRVKPNIVEANAV
jgi:hypothetical protein